MKTLTAPAAQDYVAPTLPYQQAKEYGPSYYPPTTVALSCLTDRVGEHELTILSTGPNFVGSLQHFTGHAAKFGVDLRMTSGTHFAGRYSLTLYCYSEDSTRIDSFEKFLNYKDNLVIPVQRSTPVKTIFIRILAQSKPGVIDPILQFLVEQNITLTGVAATTHPAIRAKELGYPYAGDGDIAAIKIKAGLPPKVTEQTGYLEFLQESIGAMNPYWLVLLTDTPQRDLAPAWPGANPQDYKSPGDFPYAKRNYY
jgi:glycine cleavage system regulatory protein